MHPFEWTHPTDLDDALAKLKDAGSMLVAGGTTVLDLLKLGHPAPVRMVDISRLPLTDIGVSEHYITLGGMLSNTDAAMSRQVQSCLPAVSEAILSGASQQIRNAATIAGNLMQATRCVYFRNPSWACNRREARSGCSAFSAVQPGHAILGVTDKCMAVHPSDLSVALAALDAIVIGRSQDSGFHMPISHFYKLPDDERAADKCIASASIITAVKVPTTQLAVRSGYLKLRHRASYEFASASVAAGLVVENGVVSNIAVALGGVATIPWRSREAESTLVGKKLSVPALDGFCDQLLEGAVLSEQTAYKHDLARGAVHRLIGRLASSQDLPQ